MIPRFLIIVSLIAVVIAEVTKLNNVPDYEDMREAVIQAEGLQRGLFCNTLEAKANDIFLKYKREELDKGFLNPKNNTASLHFFLAKEHIERSNLFKLLQIMPKGAVLHTHALGSVSSEGFVEAITNINGLMRCNRKDKNLNILSFRQLQQKHKCYTGYGKISDEKQRLPSFNRNFEHIISLDTANLDVKNTTAQKVRSLMQDVLTTMSDAILNLKAYRAYHMQLLKELYSDKIMYAEIRFSLNELYQDMKTYPANQSVIELINVVENFKLEHQDFLGIKLIYAANRAAGIIEMRKEFELFLELQSTYPDYIIGFDLAGDEDDGNPIYTFLDVFQNNPNSKYFFHAGETNSYGDATDLNLLDAILLNTKRIGNGFSLAKHNVLLNTVITRSIAVEVTPISNQMFRLVSDLRNHPAAVLISRDAPIVIGNDYPGLWKAKGLSYDFYYAIMSFSPIEAGLETLKKFVWNSIKYSMLQPDEKAKAYETLQTRWNQFLLDVVNEEEKRSA